MKKYTCALIIGLYSCIDVVCDSIKHPNDPLYDKQWSLHNAGYFNFTKDADIDAPETWALRKSAKNVVVAIIDSGIDYHHSDLIKNIWVNSDEIPDNGIDDDENGCVDDIHGWNFISKSNSDPMDIDGHGTAVSGVVGAVGEYALGITGVCWDVQLMAVKVNENNKSSTSSMVEGIQYAINNGAHILNFSHTWKPDRAYRKILERADSEGVIMITGSSGGKSGRDIDKRPVYPAHFDFKNLIVVAGTDAKDLHVPGSNYGFISVDVSAPATDIMTTTIHPKNGFAAWSGNSFATPIVTGVVAILKSEFPQASPQDIKKAILKGCDKKEFFKDKSVSGGRINMYNAFIHLQNQGTKVNPIP